MKTKSLKWLSSIELTIDDVYLDIHNCFDFVMFQHNVSKQEIKFVWKRGIGDWVDDALPAEIAICFSGVYYFRAIPRDPEMPLTEDVCLESFGFNDPGYSEDSSYFFVDSPPNSHWCWSFRFQSGAQLVVGAKLAEGTLSFDTSS